MSRHSLTHTALAHHQEGRLKEAEAFYRSAIEADPDDYQAPHYPTPEEALTN